MWFEVPAQGEGQLQHAQALRKTPNQVVYSMVNQRVSRFCSGLK